MNTFTIRTGAPDVIRALEAAGVLAILKDDSVISIEDHEEASRIRYQPEAEQGGKIRCAKYLIDSQGWTLTRAVNYMKDNGLW